MRTRVGYAGGEKENPTYHDLGKHSEAIQIDFDATVISYEELLDVFWHVHDPTQVDRQGPDVGAQYRSVIFYEDESQREAAEASRVALQESEAFRKRFKDKRIATEIAEAGAFWRAEEYHQDYLAKKGQETCHVGW